MSSMVFEEIEVSDVSLLENTQRERAWVIAGEVNAGPAVWVTGNDPTNANGQSGLTAPLNGAARNASTLGIDVPTELLPTNLSQVESLTQCLD
jgi:gamma-glutamylcysteine synthetase